MFVNTTLWFPSAWWQKEPISRLHCKALMAESIKTIFLHSHMTTGSTQIILPPLFSTRNKKHLENFLPTQLKGSFPGTKATKISPWNLLLLTFRDTVEQGISHTVLHHVYSVITLWAKPHVLKPFKLDAAHLIVPRDTEFAPLHLWLSDISFQLGSSWSHLKQLKKPQQQQQKNQPNRKATNKKPKSFVSGSYPQIG